MKSWLKWIAILACVAAVPFVLRATVLRPPPVEVRVFEVEVGAVEETVTNSRAGTLRARRDARLMMEITGRVVEIRAREGAVVAEGDPLVVLDATEVNAALELAQRERATAEAQVAEYEALADNARRELARTEGLLAQGAVSPEEVDQLRSRLTAAEAQLTAAEARVAQQQEAIALAIVRVRKCTLRAPFAGVVAERFIEVGEGVMPNQPVLRLIDLSELYVRADIDEVDVSRVTEGLPARVTFDALRGRSFTGTVSRVAQFVSDRERQNRTLEVEVMVEEELPPEVSRPGVSADVELILERRNDVLRVPSYAVIEGTHVLVINDTHAVRRNVETGLRNYEFVEITSGLREGEPVILSLDREEVREGVRVRRGE